MLEFVSGRDGDRFFEKIGRKKQSRSFGRSWRHGRSRLSILEKFDRFLPTFGGRGYMRDISSRLVIQTPQDEIVRYLVPGTRHSDGLEAGVAHPSGACGASVDGRLGLHPA